MRYSKAIYAALLLVLGCSSLWAQYPGGGGGTGGTTTGGTYTPGSRSYGNGAKIGVAVGAAAGAGALFYILHHRHTQVVGCVAPDGKSLKADKDDSTFELAGEPVAGGEHVSVIGKRTKGDGLEIVSVKKDFGQCEQHAEAVPQSQ